VADGSILGYWVLVFVISAPMHALAHWRRKSEKVSAFLWSCVVIAGVCGSVNLVDLLLRTAGEVKPGWALPIVVVGAGIAFPATLICGVLVRMVLASRIRKYLPKNKRNGLN